MKKLISIFLAVVMISAIALYAVPANAVTFQSIKKNPRFHYGLDVSRWNGKLDWKKLKNAGVEFAYIRVGVYRPDGAILDKKFKQNVKNAVENGIEFGVYVYSYVYKKSDNLKCAKWVHKQLKSLGNYTKDRDTIHVAYDIEDPVQVNAVSKHRITKNYLQQSVYKFIDKIEDYGYVPVVYSFQSFFRDYLYLDKFQKRNIKIWYAQWPYYSNLDTTVKKELYNNTIADIWQFGSTYTIGNIVFDTNVMYDSFYDYKNEDSKLTITGLEPSYLFSKEGIKPSVTVYDGKTKLKKNTDYKLVYFGTESCGKARIKIIRYKNGKYQETKTATYIITPTKVTGVKTESGYDEMHISWNAVRGADSYQIFEYDPSDGTYELIDETDTNSYDNYFLDEGTQYKLRICAVVNEDGISYTGTPNDFTAYTSYRKISLISADSYSKKKVTVSWNSRPSDSLGYVVEYSTDSEFSKSDSVKIENPDAENAELTLKSGKTYYFRIRLYNKVMKKTVYSIYSRTLSAVVL